MIDWEKLWEEVLERREKEAIRRRDVEYWNERAKDYADYIKASNFEHGRKIVEILEKEGVLQRDFEVLDIGAGPGSITIPLANCVSRVVAVEPSKAMCEYLREFADGLNNIEIINKRWEDVEPGKFDLVVSSNVIWVFKDLGRQIRRMIEASKKWCCIAISAVAKGEKFYDNLFAELGVEEERIPYHVFLYNVLYQLGIVPNVKVFTVTMKRPVDSAIRHLELYIGTLKELNDEDRRRIREYVLSKSEGGLFRKKSRMAVFWFRTDRE